jgi:hypothetical protein
MVKVLIFVYDSFIVKPMIEKERFVVTDGQRQMLVAFGLYLYLGPRAFLTLVIFYDHSFTTLEANTDVSNTGRSSQAIYQSFFLLPKQ